MKIVSDINKRDIGLLGGIDRMLCDRPTHMSLFSGIGGLDIAADWAGFETVAQCEKATFPYEVLNKHWCDVPKWRYIHELTVQSFRERTGLETVNCISGGFPCQPHSVAGKRKASADARDLWPEMRRIIGEIKPRWVVGENVRGLLSSENGRFFRGILRDFAEMGYDVGWGITSAAAVGAIHRRERIAIIAWNADSKQSCEIREIFERSQFDTSRNSKVFTNINKFGFQRWLFEEKQQKTDEQFERICLHLLGRADAYSLSKSAILRKHDGFSNRVDRIKSLGNAVVPQQFYPIFKAIYDYEMCLQRKH